ncbi:MAG: DNA/RNA non-specific endonuclease [Candidatus Zixiibacteriota bacterium]|jgi:endonuclease G
MKVAVPVATALAIAGAAFAYDASDGAYPEIHCKHFFYGYPTGAPLTNDMIIRDIYALSSNDETKFADWVAYRLDEETVTGPSIDYDYWKTEPWLDAAETLEAKPPADDDYRGARAELGTDRGHQAPLAAFKGTDCWKETFFYSNATPQKKELNQGPWKNLEERVRGLVYAGHVVYVMTGPLYEYGTEGEIPKLPHADEPHLIPSAYWKIVAIRPTTDPDSIRAAAFIFEQDTPRNDAVLGHLATVAAVEDRSGLIFFRELPAGDQTRIKNDNHATWAAEYFGP